MARRCISVLYIYHLLWRRFMGIYPSWYIPIHLQSPDGSICYISCRTLMRCIFFCHSIATWYNYMGSKPPAITDKLLVSELDSGKEIIPYTYTSHHRPRPWGMPNHYQYWVITSSLVLIGIYIGYWYK